MHYFDDGTYLRPANGSRPSRRFLTPDKGDQAGRQRRNGRPPTRSRKVRPGGLRDHPGLLDGRRIPDLNGEIAPRAELDSGLDDSTAEGWPEPGAWGVPTTRPPSDGGAYMAALPSLADEEPGAGRVFRTVADGLAIAPRVSIVVPVMNEAANLPGVFKTIPSWIDEIILVDGRSTDNTIEVARSLRPDVRVVLQGGMGKGDALVAGFTASRGDIIVAIDGDGSTDGAEIVRFVSALMAGADFAKGSRFSSAGHTDDITGIRRLGNKVLNVIVNRLFHTSFSDLCYGYNAFWARHLHELALDSPGFEVETLMSIRAAEAGLRIYEVPSHERLRQHGTSNLSAIKDGWRILRLIAAEKRAVWRRRAQERRAARRRKAAKPKPFMAPGYLAQHGPGELPLQSAIALASAGQADAATQAQGPELGGASRDSYGHGGYGGGYGRAAHSASSAQNGGRTAGTGVGHGPTGQVDR